jgi:hypothetical protein
MLLTLNAAPQSFSAAWSSRTRRCTNDTNAASAQEAVQ